MRRDTEYQGHGGTLTLKLCRPASYVLKYGIRSGDQPNGVSKSLFLFTRRARQQTATTTEQ